MPTGVLLAPGTLYRVETPALLSEIQKGLPAAFGDPPRVDQIGVLDRGHARQVGHRGSSAARSRTSGRGFPALRGPAGRTASDGRGLRPGRPIFQDIADPFKHDSTSWEMRDARRRADAGRTIGRRKRTGVPGGGLWGDLLPPSKRNGPRPVRTAEKAACPPPRVALRGPRLPGRGEFSEEAAGSPAGCGADCIEPVTSNSTATERLSGWTSLSRDSRSLTFSGSIFS